VIDPLQPHVFASNAKAQGLDPRQVDRALAEHRALRGRGLPTVWSLGHLAWLSETSYQCLRAVVDRSTDSYTDQWVQRPFRRTRRHISAPHPGLQRAQTWVLQNVLRATPTHSASSAFEMGNSTLECASQHVGATWMVKADLKNFFHSIDEIQVFKLLSGYGYPRLIAFEMARVCTRVLDKSPTSEARNTYSIPAYQPGMPGVLPQGAPTSGALANRVARGLDDRLEAIAAEGRMVYTRYADDLAFSTREYLGHCGVGRLLTSIRKAVGLSAAGWCRRPPERVVIASASEPICCARLGVYL
jgi:RNA-directed DNA polymerase